MKCSDMLMRLLEAERDELEGVGNSLVAAHVRDCATCQAVARRLLANTMLLVEHVETQDAGKRMGVSAKSRRSQMVSRGVLWGGALAATTAAAMLLAPARQAPGARSTPASTFVRAVPTPAADTSPRASSRRKAPPAHAQNDLIPVQATRFPDAVAATPARFVASQPTEQRVAGAELLGVSVAPPVGTRSVVLATRNPKITVVWLY